MNLAQMPPVREMENTLKNKFGHITQDWELVAQELGGKKIRAAYFLTAIHEHSQRQTGPEKEIIQSMIKAETISIVKVFVEDETFLNDVRIIFFQSHTQSQ